MATIIIAEGGVSYFSRVYEEKSGKKGYKQCKLHMHIYVRGAKIVRENTDRHTMEEKRRFSKAWSISRPSTINQRISRRVLQIKQSERDMNSCTKKPRGIAFTLYPTTSVPRARPNKERERTRA